MRQTREYETVKMLYGDTDNDYSIREWCDALQITRSAYYHWLNGAKSQRELTNDRLVQGILEIYEQYTDKGYRRIRDDLNRRYGGHVSDKRVLRLMRKERIQSTIKHPHNCDKAMRSNPDANPLLHSDKRFQYTSRDFHVQRQKYSMVQSMSRIGHCIDNGPMEGFRGILKREMYYKHIY